MLFSDTFLYKPGNSSLKMALIKDIIKEGINLLISPKSGFTKSDKKPLEDVVSNYLRLLMVLSIVAAFVNFLFRMGRTLYLDITRSLDIDYTSLFNFTLSEFFAYIFGYFLAGTFIMFLISLVLHQFYRKIKYADFMKIFMYSMYPLLLFSWLPILVPSLVLWSGFLLFNCIRRHKSYKISKSSINQRD